MSHSRKIKYNRRTLVQNKKLIDRISSLPPNIKSSKIRRDADRLLGLTNRLRRKQATSTDPTQPRLLDKAHSLADPHTKQVCGVRIMTQKKRDEWIEIINRERMEIQKDIQLRLSSKAILHPKKTIQHLGIKMKQEMESSSNLSLSRDPKARIINSNSQVTQLPHFKLEVVGSLTTVDSLEES